MDQKTETQLPQQYDQGNLGSVGICSLLSEWVKHGRHYVRAPVGKLTKDQLRKSVDAHMLSELEKVAGKKLDMKNLSCTWVTQREDDPYEEPPEMNDQAQRLDKDDYLVPIGVHWSDSQERSHSAWRGTSILGKTLAKEKDWTTGKNNHWLNDEKTSAKKVLGAEVPGEMRAATADLLQLRHPTLGSVLEQYDESMKVLPKNSYYGAGHSAGVATAQGTIPVAHKYGFKSYSFTMFGGVNAYDQIGGKYVEALPKTTIVSICDAKDPIPTWGSGNPFFSLGKSIRSNCGKSFPEAHYITNYEDWFAEQFKKGK